MNQGSWTNAEKRFVRDNAGKLTVEEMACRIGRTSSAVKMFLIRNRISVGTQIKRNILQEILKIKFVHPEYFKPTRAFYKAVGMFANTLLGFILWPCTNYRAGICSNNHAPRNYPTGSIRGAAIKPL